MHSDAGQIAVAHLQKRAISIRRGGAHLFTFGWIPGSRWAMRSTGLLLALLGPADMSGLCLLTEAEADPNMLSLSSSESDPGRTSSPQLVEERDGV